MLVVLCRRNRPTPHPSTPPRAPKVANNSEQQAPKRAREAVFGLMMSALQKDSCAASLRQFTEEETNLVLKGQPLLKHTPRCNDGNNNGNKQRTCSVLIAQAKQRSGPESSHQHPASSRRRLPVCLPPLLFPFTTSCSQSRE